MSHGSICFPRVFYLKNTRMLLRDSECTSPTGEKQKGNVYSVGGSSIKKELTITLEVRKPILKSIRCLRRITWCSVKVGSIIKATFTLRGSLSPPGQWQNIDEKGSQKAELQPDLNLYTDQALRYHTEPKIRFELLLYLYVLGFNLTVKEHLHLDPTPIPRINSVTTDRNHHRTGSPASHSDSWWHCKTQSECY